MYLRETKRRNADGTEVAYLALAHNERDPETGVPKARIVHNFGRTDAVDREALARLVRSISRFLEPAEAVSAAATGEISVLDSRPMGAYWLVDRLWARLGIGRAVNEAAVGRKLDGESAERVIFAMVANRLSVKPLSKLACVGWAANRARLPEVPEFTDDDCYRAMDFLVALLPKLQETVFFSVANLLNLEVDLIFFDTTSTYWQTGSADDALLDDEEEADNAERAERAAEAAVRTWGHSKDHRADLPQVVVGMAVTREGVPVRVWTFPGNTSDQVLLRTVKDDLRSWDLARVIWVLDRGFSSAENRRYLQRAGGGYIMGEKLRGSSHEAAVALARAGRYHTVAGNLRVKQVHIDDGAARDRFVICHNPDEARRDAQVRGQILSRLEEAIDGADNLSPREQAELAGKLKTKPAFNRSLRTTAAGKLRVDRAAVAKDAHLDGKYLLRTSDESLSAADIAEGYKALYQAERGWRDLKTIQVHLRPVYHRKDSRTQAHVQLCWLALLVMRVAELACGDTWRNLRDELDRMHLVTFATNEGTVSQRTELTAGQRSILRALELPEPPRFYDSARPRTDPQL